MEIVAVYTAQSLPFTLDFDNHIWAPAHVHPLDYDWRGAEAPAELKTVARLLWTDEEIFIGFTCSFTELDVDEEFSSAVERHALWDRDVCEIFIAPDPANPARYFEFEAAPTGEWVDLGIIVRPDGRETDWDFVSGFTTTAKLDCEQLTIEMRIPWSEAIPKPAAGDVWRVNLFRCVGPEAPERYLAWSPTRTPEPNFHVPEAFGELRFISR